MARRLSVVISQSQSQSPAKRRLEESIVEALLLEPGIDVTIVPHLYDLKSDSSGLLALSGIGGHLVLLSWLFERAARWTLDRHGIRGQVGITLIREMADDEDDEEANEVQHTPDDRERVATTRDVPRRNIYCLDLRVHEQAGPYIEEIRRIAREQATPVVNLAPGGWLGGTPQPAQLARFVTPTNDTSLPVEPSQPVSQMNSPPLTAASPAMSVNVVRIEEEPDRRWYPVIDYGRCTNCMECIDFCLFGVYGVDRAETILVEQPDNCRKGCPACSRVCPENAIIFPQHKTPSIAGSELANAGGLKIDLSKLFGAPETGESAEEAAIRERDEQLVAAGRHAVGASTGLPKRHQSSEAEAKDELDALIDQLDELDI